MTTLTTRAAALGALSLALIATLAAAQAPLIIDFEGKITFTGNASTVNGTRTVTFVIYDQATGGVPVWNETHSLFLTGGLFNTLLGGSVPLDGVPFNRALYLEVIVSGEALTPRLNFTKAPFALSVSGRFWVNDTAIFLNGTVPNLTVILLNSTTIYQNGSHPVQRLIVWDADCRSSAGKHLVELSQTTGFLTLTPFSSPVTNDSAGLPNGTIVEVFTGQCEYTAGPADCQWVKASAACSTKSYCGTTANCSVNTYLWTGGLDCRPSGDTLIDVVATDCPAFGGACIGNQTPPITADQWLGECYFDKHAAYENYGLTLHSGFVDDQGDMWTGPGHSAGEAAAIDVFALCCPYNNP
jgi:hypothetical protein